MIITKIPKINNDVIIAAPCMNNYPYPDQLCAVTGKSGIYCRPPACRGKRYRTGRGCS